MAYDYRTTRRQQVLTLFAVVAAGCSDGSEFEMTPGVDARRSDATAFDSTTLPPPTDGGTSSGEDGGPSRTDGSTSVPPDGAAAVENCATPFDDNGDGVANEGCVCSPGTTQMCFERTEPQFRGMCRMGTQRCMGSGEFGMWGPCERSWLPLPDFMNQCEATQRFDDTMAARVPVDIIWFIDTSGSMVEETRNLNANLNRFASTLAMSGLDYRVIMIGTRGTGSLQVCVPPPLAGAGCSDGPRFRHVNSNVASTNGLQVVVSTYPSWRDFLRPTSQKFFVAVTDDESSMPANTFHTTASGWPGFTGYVFNSIVGYESRADCPTLARRGGVYLDLTARTMGDRARVCATDWSGIFTSFAMGIVRRTTAWVLAQPARMDTIQVWIVTAAGTRTQLMMGWTYDMAANRVTVDPAVIPMGARVEIIYRPIAGSP